MPREITAEQRREWAAKAGATNHARREAERERFRAEIRDRENALEICRKIRDNENASDADRLEAIRLIEAIKAQR